MLSLQFYIMLAMMHNATTYGYNEVRCGDVNRPVSCGYFARMASGELFDPNAAIVALPMPFKRRMHNTFYIYVKDVHNICQRLRVADKKHERYVGTGGLDLTPGALKKLGITPNRYWSRKLTLCNDGGF